MVSMEKLFMSAGVVAAIVLCIIGIIKLPFDDFKKSHPSIYKAIFTIFTFVLALALSILDEIFILCGQILSLDFVILTIAVLSGVFGCYNGIYEGLGLKELVKKLVDNVKKTRDMTSDKKVYDFLNNIDDIDKAIKILEERKNNNNNGEI